MKILVKHFQYSTLLLFSLLFSTFIFADDTDHIFEIGEDYWSVNTIESIDLLEPINRKVYYFNDFIYLNIFDPITNVYVNYTPATVRHSFRNFFTNIKYPIRLISNVLQIKFKEAFYESLKFGMNSTVGILGIMTPSDKFNFLNSIPNEDIGQAFAIWGIPEGPYIVLPILGPSTLRDLPARVIEPGLNFMNTRSQSWNTYDPVLATIFDVTKILSINEEILPLYKSIKKTSIDPYSATRAAYLQQRANEISE